MIQVNYAIRIKNDCLVGQRGDFYTVYNVYLIMNGIEYLSGTYTTLISAELAVDEAVCKLHISEVLWDALED